MGKKIFTGSFFKFIAAVFVLSFIGALSAKADNVTLTAMTAGPAGTGFYASNCVQGDTGTFDINASGGVAFLSNTGCYFGLSTLAPFSSTGYATYQSGGSVANLLALANGTYFETGIACNTTSVPSSCNPGSGIPPATITFGIYINNGTIIISSSNAVITGGSPTAIAGGSITVEFTDAPTTTPEPASVLLMGIGLLTLAGAGIFRKNLGLSL